MGALIAAVASIRFSPVVKCRSSLWRKRTPQGNAGTIANTNQPGSSGGIYAGLGFVPLIATTALATGVYAVRALPLFMRWAISRRIRWLQRIRRSGYFGGSLAASFDRQMLGRYPSVRNASDNIRNAMNI